MVQALPQTPTLDTFLQLPETKPASEYIQGQIRQKNIPQGEHSVIQTELAATLNAVLKPSKVARTFVELRCTFGDVATQGQRSLVPDISVFTRERIPRTETGSIANRFWVAPDWTIEILSPQQSQTKVIRNILHCLNHGSQLGWLIDPAERSVLIFEPNQATVIVEQLDAQLPVPQFAQDVHLTLQTLLDWLTE